MKTKIEKIKELDLPKSEEFWVDISYFGGTKKELFRLENILDFEIYQNEKEFFLSVNFKNWYQKGPLDVPQTMIEKIQRYKWENDCWEKIELETFIKSVG